MAGLEIVPFSDAHLDDAAALLAARHARHREAEPLLAGATSTFAPRSSGSGARRARRGVVAAARRRLPARRRSASDGIWLAARRASPATPIERRPRADARPLRRRGRSAGSTEGCTSHVVFVPVARRRARRRLVPARRSAARRRWRCARPARRSRSTADVTIRRGTPDDYDEAARLDRELSGAAARTRRASRRSRCRRLRRLDDASGARRTRRARRCFVARARRAHRRAPAALPPARPTCACRASSIDLAQASTEARGARHGRRRGADRARARLGPRARLPGDDDRLADDEPAGRRASGPGAASDGVPPALPVDPASARASRCSSARA